MEQGYDDSGSIIFMTTAKEGKEDSILLVTSVYPPSLV